MIALIATLKIAEGKTADFEAAFAKANEIVRANEPGCLLYQLTRSRTQPNVYKVMELYKDEDAFAFHRDGEHRKAAPSITSMFDGRPEIEFLDAVG